MTYDYLLTNSNKCSTPMQAVNVRRNFICVERGTHENFLYFLLNVSVNLKLYQIKSMNLIK